MDSKARGDTARSSRIEFAFVRHVRDRATSRFFRTLRVVHFLITVKIAHRGAVRKTGGGVLSCERRKSAFCTAVFGDIRAAKAGYGGRGGVCGSKRGARTDGARFAT